MKMFERLFQVPNVTCPSCGHGSFRQEGGKGIKCVRCPATLTLHAGLDSLGRPTLRVSTDLVLVEPLDDWRNLYWLMSSRAYAHLSAHLQSLEYGPRALRTASEVSAAWPHIQAEVKGLRKVLRAEVARALSDLGVSVPRRNGPR